MQKKIQTILILSLVLHSMFSGMVFLGISSAAAASANTNSSLLNSPVANQNTITTVAQSLHAEVSMVANKFAQELSQKQSCIENISGQTDATVLPNLQPANYNLQSTADILSAQSALDLNPNLQNNCAGISAEKIISQKYLVVGSINLDLSIQVQKNNLSFVLSAGDSTTSFAEATMPVAVNIKTKVSTQVQNIFILNAQPSKENFILLTDQTKLNIWRC